MAQRHGVTKLTLGRAQATLALGTLMKPILLGLLGCTLWCCNPATTCQHAGLCVDCNAVCTKMVDCHVSFAAGDGPVLGANDPHGKCVRGCFSSDTITPERAQCIHDVDSANRDRCQKRVLGCLGADAGSLY